VDGGAGGAIVSVRRVYVTTGTVGDHAGTVGVVRDARTKRQLAATGIKPYGFLGAAIGHAEAIALDRRWLLVSGPDEDRP
jgi:hypothetical protein